MNFQNLSFDYVEGGERRQVPNPPSTRSIVTVIRVTAADEDEDKEKENVSTASAQPTTVIYAPSQPSATESSSDMYGPERHRLLGHGMATTAQPMAVHSMVPQTVPRATAWETEFDAATLTGFKDTVLRENDTVTPDAAHGPNILYALDALTRDRHAGYAPEDDYSDDEGAAPVQGARRAPPPHQCLLPAPTILPQARPQQATAQPPTLRGPAPKMPPWAFESALPAAYDLPIPPTLRADERVIGPHHWKCLNGEIETLGLPRLDYRPRMLRWPSFLGLMMLCVLTTAGLVACAVYSSLHGGLLPWASIYGSQYFLFRVLPPTLGLGVLLYAQSMVTTAQRIVPFARLASESPGDRAGAVMEDLYPRSFLWPHLTGPWTVWVPVLMTWLANSTVPLHSAAFTVVFRDGRWMWTMTQGVAWTLVALYVGLFASTAVAWAHWGRVKVTGLLWDPRSLADVACMIAKSNVMAWYRGSKTAGTRESIRYSLRRRADDQLAFWAWKDGRRGGRDWWYALGNTMDGANFAPVPSTLPKGSLMDHGLPKGAEDGEPDGRAPHLRRRYLPWCLRTTPLFFSVLAAWATLVTMLVISFLPATRLSAGFLPYLSAAPGPGAFSAADFLYSFLPSALGMLLYLAFATLDRHVRVLTPWAALSAARGASPRSSMLADYAACSLPVRAALHAARDRSWGAAVVSGATALLALLPVCAGATFMALTVTSTGQVRMFPNMGALAGLVILMAVAAVALLLLLLSRREPLGLPHQASCLAEVVGLLVSDDLQADPAFGDCRCREDMLLAMGLGAPGKRTWCGRRWADEGADRWAFGFPSAADDGDHVLGVRRVARFTDRRRRAAERKSQMPPVRQVTGGLGGMV